MLKKYVRKEHIKKTIQYDLLDFLLRMKGFFKILKSININSPNILKSRNHMIALIDAEKTFDVIEHSFMMNTLEVGDEI